MTPTKQMAVQLVGPDELQLNDDKPVHRPGPRQILGRVECVGLCFSDMKLLKQFDQHARKIPVLEHLDEAVLSEIPTYVPEGKPTVPGHEVVVRVEEVGEGVESVQVGQRYLVQADWRDLKTAKSNGAFGYNFEGGLQQYVLLDERCTVAKDGTSYLLPAKEERSASATALVEPWACIEDAFLHHERQGLATGGTLLVVPDGEGRADLDGLDLSPVEKRLYLCEAQGEACTCPEGFSCVGPDVLADESIDDCCFAGADAALFERLMPKLAKNAVCIIATGGASFGRPVSVPVGRVHYGNLRFVGTVGTRFAEAQARIPLNGEVREGDQVHVIGAAGPMGSMAVIRIVSLGLPGLKVDGSDMAMERLGVLRRKAEPVAVSKQIPLRLFNPQEGQPTGAPDYVMLMVPVGPLVAKSVADVNEDGVINIFAGIPSEVSQDIDLDAYCAKRLYFIGTSGSTMEDMQAVLRKVEAGELDTNLSVGAVSGFGGAIEGLEAVRDGKVSGKILVYPALGDFPLTSLEELAERYPSIGERLIDGNWSKAAEEELLRLAGN